MASPRTALVLALLAAAPTLCAAWCKKTVGSDCHIVVGTCSVFPCAKTRGSTCQREEVFGYHVGLGKCVCTGGYCGLNGKCVPPSTCMRDGDAPGGDLPTELMGVQNSTAPQANVAVASTTAGLSGASAAVFLAAAASVGAVAGLVLRASREPAQPVVAEAGQAAAQDAAPSAPYAPLGAEAAWDSGGRRAARQAGVSRQALGWWLLVCICSRYATAETPRQAGRCLASFDLGF
eukprot:CAMPEP_0175506836 /NCGR_PEP_ID=MMETSP0096-20121207/9553_1 /TAXON_ID=311494 /ORGANISM="Alexandrium monilatum, Strain CCMP3105" /LENGTH=233 /DNA_ID=CAMNT_0016808943 /DNA_START=93 /DNA_END=792 /DNA_ORIENTATION=-